MSIPYPYTVRFIKGDEVLFTARVTAATEKEAIVMAKVRASMAGVFILEARIEVL